MEFLWRIFPLLRANRLYAICNTGLKKMAFSIRNIFMSSSTRSTGFGSVCHEPCPTTNFFFSFFRWREEGATSVLGSQPITWLLSSSFQCQATQVRSPSINICGSPLCDLHSFLTVILWRLATVNSNKTPRDKRVLTTIKNFLSTQDLCTILNIMASPVSWGFRIPRLYPMTNDKITRLVSLNFIRWWGLNPGAFGMWSTNSLPLLSGFLLPRLVVLLRLLLMDKVELLPDL